MSTTDETGALRVLLGGSVPPEWGGATSGGVASMHRVLIEEFVARRSNRNPKIVGLLPFNFDSSSGSGRPPVEPLYVPPVNCSSLDFYEHILESSEPDVVLFQHVAHRWAAYHSRLGAPVPAVGVVHSIHQLKRQGHDAGRIKRLMEEALGGLQGVVFVSENTRRELESFGLAYRCDAVVIHNPLSRLFLTPAPADSEVRSGWVFVGSLIERKNPFAVLEAASRLGKSVTVIGSGPLDPELRATCARLTTSDRVKFVGSTSPEEVWKYLRRAELLCVPSSSEGFSMAYLEALACGTPIIGSAPNVAELNGVLGIVCGAPVEYGTAEEVEACGRWIDSQHWDRSELRRRAVDTFGPQRIASAYASFLKGIVGDSRSAGASVG